MPPIRRLLRSVDFERVLGQTPSARSPHFAVHHVVGMPMPVGRPSKAEANPARSAELSTGGAPNAPMPVDDSSVEALAAGFWLGAVVPKRHARRSVTRTLLKRTIRATFAAHSASLGPGLWVIRLRAGFDVARFPSAASSALRDAAGEELAGTLRRAAAR